MADSNTTAPLIRVGSEIKWVPRESDFSMVGKIAGVLTITQIAEVFGVSKKTFERRMNSYPELRRAYKKGKTDCIIEIADLLIEKARMGNLGAQKFYLQCMAGWSDRPRSAPLEGEGLGIEAETADAARRDVMGRLDLIARRIEEDERAKRAS